MRRRRRVSRWIPLNGGQGRVFGFFGLCSPRKGQPVLVYPVGTFSHSIRGSGLGAKTHIAKVDRRTWRRVKVYLP